MLASYYLLLFRKTGDVGKFAISAFIAGWILENAIARGKRAFKVLLHERGLDLCLKRVRRWVDRFGPMFAGKIRMKRASFMRQHMLWKWHRDEVFVTVNGVQNHIRRAVDHDGKVLDS